MTSSFWLWLTYALVTPMFWAVNNVLDRMMMTRLIRNEYTMTFIGAFTRLPFFLIFLVMTGWYVPPLWELLLALLSGILVILPVVFYYKALEKDEAVPMMILYDAMNPLFVLFLAIPFLGERLNVSEGIAFVSLLAAGVLGSLTFQGKKMHFRHGAPWIILAALLWAHADVLLGYLVPRFPSVLSLLTWEFIGSFLGGFLFLLVPSFRKRCQLQDFRWPVTWWITYGIATVIAYAGYYTFLKAFVLERVSLTTVISNVQPLFVFLFGLIAAYLSPRLFEKIDTNKRSLIPKTIAFVLVLIGVWLLQA